MIFARQRNSKTNNGQGLDRRLIIFILILLGMNVLFFYYQNNYLLTLTKLTLIQVALAVSLTACNGFTGIFSLGHPAFMTLGAYVAIIFTYPVAKRNFAMPDLPMWLTQVELPLIIAAGIGAFIAGLFAYFLGKIVLHLKTHYLAIASLGLIIVTQNIMLNLDGITRGGRGMTAIPREANLFLISIIVLISVMTVWRLKHSSLGRAMLSVRENEMAARCAGIDATKIKMIAFVLGAVIAAYAGAMIPHVIAVMSPKSFGLITAFNLIAIIVVGGQGNITGAIIVTVILAILSEVARPIEEKLGLYGLTQVMIAFLLIIFLLKRPKGLFGLNEPFAKDK